MESTVHLADIVSGFERLGVRGRRVIVHASLSSFGEVAGGADTVVDALVGTADAVLVPTFTYSPAAVVPEHDRPARNGANYDEDPCGSAAPTPFTPDLQASKPIGVIAETLRRRPGAVRSTHPLASFAAIGRDAARYVVDHDWNDPTQPIERLHRDNGCVLMLGTLLTSCTAIHLGEKLAGRRPFIRWAKLADGRICRVRVGGCSAGFEKLAGEIEGARDAWIGKARVRLFTIEAVVAATIRRLTQDSFALVCAARCARCLDAAAGGPLE